MLAVSVNNLAASIYAKVKHILYFIVYDMMSTLCSKQD